MQVRFCKACKIYLMIFLSAKTHQDQVKISLRHSIHTTRANYFVSNKSLFTCRRAQQKHGRKKTV